MLQSNRAVVCLLWSSHDPVHAHFGPVNTLVVEGVTRRKGIITGVKGVKQVKRDQKGSKGGGYCPAGSAGSTPRACSTARANRASPVHTKSLSLSFSLYLAHTRSISFGTWLSLSLFLSLPLSLSLALSLFISLPGFLSIVDLVM
jgi:hypothetical protein